MQPIPVNYSDMQPGSEETTMVSFCQEPDGRFAGAVMPMLHPLDTKMQWHSLIDGLISNAIIVDPDANLDGMYTFSWWADHKKLEHSGMVFTRLSDEANDEGLEGYRLPKDTLGLFWLSTDEGSKNKIGVLALSGYVSSKSGIIREDRVLGSLIAYDGTVITQQMTQEDKREVISFGKVLNELLNDSIRLRQDS